MRFNWADKLAPEVDLAFPRGTPAPAVEVLMPHVSIYLAKPDEVKTAWAPRGHGWATGHLGGDALELVRLPVIPGVKLMPDGGIGRSAEQVDARFAP